MVDICSVRAPGEWPVRLRFMSATNNHSLPLYSFLNKIRASVCTEVMIIHTSVECQFCVSKLRNSRLRSIYFKYGIRYICGDDTKISSVSTDLIQVAPAQSLFSNDT